jgi:hypothetical protein
MDKLQSKDAATATMADPTGSASPFVPPVPRPQTASPGGVATSSNNISNAQEGFQSQAMPMSAAHIQQGQMQARESKGGKTMIRDNDEGIIIDLGEGISLNIPIQKRMSLGDFLKVAEKVKALEMLSEDTEYKKNY